MQKLLILYLSIIEKRAKKMWRFSLPQTDELGQGVNPASEHKLSSIRLVVLLVDSSF